MLRNLFALDYLSISQSLKVQRLASRKADVSSGFPVKAFDNVLICEVLLNQKSCYRNTKKY